MVKLIDHIPEGLKFFFNSFQQDLTQPQFENLKAWTAGLLNGLVDASKIAGPFSAKHASSLTRFMEESPWNHKKLNGKRIIWTLNILSQRYSRYYPIIIDDTVNKKYGELLDGVGRYWSNSEKSIVWGQTIVSSHIVLAKMDIPLFVDLYIKGGATKIEIAKQHIQYAPKIDARVGVVITDSWYSSSPLIKKIIEMKFEGILALKKNRKVNFKGKLIKVEEIAASLQETDFDNKTVEGKVYQCWTWKVKLPGIQLKKSQLLISRQKLKNNKWSEFKFLFVTDPKMSKWTILFLYRKRWKIESFYRFAKSALDFDKSRLESRTAITRYFILLFFAYSYLMLTRFPLFSFEYPSKSLYEALDRVNANEMEALVEYVHEMSSKGVDLEDIKLELGFTEKNA